MPFVSVDGIDGSGKTLQTELFVIGLLQMGKVVVRTKEPDGGHICRDVRSIMVAERSLSLSPLEEMLLVSAARVDHVRSVIRPALQAGKWVVSDHFIDPTFAFQVFENSVSEDAFDSVARSVVGQTMPDLTFILDVDIKAALDRRGGRAASKKQTQRRPSRNSAGLGAASWRLHGEPPTAATSYRRLLRRSRSRERSWR